MRHAIFEAKIYRDGSVIGPLTGYRNAIVGKSQFKVPKCSILIDSWMVVTFGPIHTGVFLHQGTYLCVPHGLPSINHD